MSVLTPNEDEGPKIRLGLPKGSLQETTVSLFAKAGYDVRISGRSYYPSIDDPEIECILIRPQEMARYVGQGVLDCAITGLDWVIESGADVEELADLRAPWPNYGPVRWILAVKNDSPFQTPKDLEGKRIATEVMGMTERYFAEQGIEASLEFSWGATEVKVPDLVDAIVDLTETGNSIRANNLRIVDTLLNTNTVLIANKVSWKNPAKRKKIENIALLLTSALEASTKVGLKLNIEKSKLEAILTDLPALRNPTINRLTDESWVAIDTILDEKVVREIIPELKERGAEGIIEYPLNKVVF